MNNQNPQNVGQYEQDEAEKKERRPALVLLILIGVLIVVCLCLGPVGGYLGFMTFFGGGSTGVAVSEEPAPVLTPTPTAVPGPIYTCEIVPFWAVPGSEQSVPVLVVISGDGNILDLANFPEDGGYGSENGSFTYDDEGVAYFAASGDQPGESFRVWYESDTLGVRCEWAGQLVTDAFLAGRFGFWDFGGDVWDYDLIAPHANPLDYDDLVAVWVWLNGYPIPPDPAARDIPAVAFAPESGKAAWQLGSAQAHGLSARDSLAAPASAAPLIQAIQNPALPIPDPLSVAPGDTRRFPVPDGHPLPPEWVADYGPDVEVIANAGDLLIVIPETTTFRPDLYGAQVFWPWEWTFEPFEMRSLNARAQVRGAWSGLVYDSASGESAFWIERGAATVEGLPESEALDVAGPDDGEHVLVVAIAPDGVVGEPEMLDAAQFQERFGLLVWPLSGRLVVAIEVAGPLPPLGDPAHRSMVWELLLDIDGEPSTGWINPVRQYTELGIDILYASYRGELECAWFEPAFSDNAPSQWGQSVTCQQPVFALSYSPDGRFVYISADWSMLAQGLGAVGAQFDPQLFTWRFAHAHYGAQPDSKDTFPDSPTQTGGS